MVIIKDNHIEGFFMTIELIKRLLDACYEAKRIRDMLPPLPDGVTPSYIHFLDVIEQMEINGTSVKVSDISDALNLPRPGVTRTVKEMEQKGYLTKSRPKRMHASCTFHYRRRQKALCQVQRTGF